MSLEVLYSLQGGMTVTRKSCRLSDAALDCHTEGRKREVVMRRFPKVETAVEGFPGKGSSTSQYSRGGGGNS